VTRAWILSQSFATALQDGCTFCRSPLKEKLEFALHEYNCERGSTMFKIGSFVGTWRMPVLALMLVAATLTGCESKQDQAVDQAKKQAATTGQAQQVVSVDKNGTTTTTIVQPPAAGQKDQAIATTATPLAAGAPIPAPSGPTVSAVPQPPPTVNIAAGTTLTTRVDQRIGVKSSRAGDTFTGELVDPVLASDNSVILPKGALVGGVVDVSHRRGHFKGRSLLELRLTSLTLNGTQYPLVTADLAQSKKGKGKRSAALIGGGSGLGMLVGGLATGGVGVVVGGLVGGGAGTAVAGLTGNRDINIPAESIVRFTLADDLVVQLTQ
jgi:hypothetical protein